MQWRCRSRNFVAITSVLLLRLCLWWTSAKQLALRFVPFFVVSQSPCSKKGRSVFCWLVQLFVRSFVRSFMCSFVCLCVCLHNSDCLCLSLALCVSLSCVSESFLSFVSSLKRPSGVNIFLTVTVIITIKMTMSFSLVLMILFVRLLMLMSLSVVKVT